jgi:hypothetical protein
MAKKKHDENQPYATGPGAGLDQAAGSCDQCGRGELVKTTTPEGDELAPVYDTLGGEVKQGATVTVCALCGAVQAPPKPKRKAKAKSKAKKRSAARKPARTRKPATRKRAAGRAGGR